MPVPVLGRIGSGRRGQPLVQSGTHLVRGVGGAPALGPGDRHARRGDPGHPGQAEYLPPAHLPRLRAVRDTSAILSLARAVDLTRTGDIWLFRGRTAADRAIQTLTNAPVNHVGMALVLDDLPPLMWHAELGRSLPDIWSGQRRRGAQLHLLEDAVRVWGNRYGQRAWLRQLDRELGRTAENAALRTVAQLDGTPFPSAAAVFGRWFGARSAGSLAAVGRAVRGAGRPGAGAEAGTSSGTGPETAREAALETAYCAEVVAAAYQAMGLLPRDRAPSWYDPGRFWSGDDLPLRLGARLGAEIEVLVPVEHARHRAG